MQVKQTTPGAVTLHAADVCCHTPFDNPARHLIRDQGRLKMIGGAFALLNLGVAEPTADTTSCGLGRSSQ